MNRRWIGLLCLLLAALSTAPATAAQPPRQLQSERAVFRAFDAGDYQRAANLLEEHLKRWPDDPDMIYNLACAYCRLGEAEKAGEALLRAVRAGFRDFEHMRTDPDLAAIRGEELFQAILEAARRVDVSPEGALKRWKEKFGEDGYRYETDEQRRLAFATALDDRSHREMRDMLQRQADHLRKTLFGEPPAYFVLVAVPTPSDANIVFGGDAAIGGRYEHANRRLIARDIGRSLRHEFVHAMHYGHMERLGLTQAHPIWIQEGLATLYETYEEGKNGSITFLPNDRDNVARRLANTGRLTKWADLFSMSPQQFMRRPGQLYPQVRAIFEYLAEEGKLGDWYHAYVEHFTDDISGARALGIVFDRPAHEVEQTWRNWLRKRPEIDTDIDYGDAALGIEGDINGSNDGVRIARILANSAASRSRLRPDDVIVSIDGRPTRNFAELRAIVAARRVGERIELRVRRNGRYFKVLLVLQPLRGVR
ncbi:MAG: PDZ domain-containing protein [Planctomycetota bacterium]|nr:PDZ domain-containing protein [Planctomycetota bacterium]